MNSSITGVEYYKRLLGYSRPYWPAFAVAICSMLLFAVTDTGFAALMKPMLDGNFIERDPDAIRFVPLALLALFFFRGITGFMSRYAMTWIGRRVVADLRRDLFKQITHLPATYYDHTPPGTLLSRLTYDVEQVAEAATNAVIILIRDSLTMFFLLAYMIWISTWLTLLFFLIGPVLVWLIRMISKRFRIISSHIQDSMGELTQFCGEVIHGHRLIKSFNAQRWQQKEFAEVNQRNRRLHLKMAVPQCASSPIVQFIASTMLALLIYLATIESLKQEISVGTFVSFIAAMMLLMQPLKRLTNINASIQRGLAAAQSVFGILDEAVEIDAGQRPLTIASGTIEFRNVTFSYENNRSTALDNISLTIAAGETVALVGRSGSGKSTLTDLLNRFYNPQQGEILLDGHNISEYRLDDLRNQIATVSQDVVLFNDTVAHNIRFGSLDTISEEKIIQAAQAAHAMEFIDNLSAGIHTPIGDQGSLLSGGQRQRISIARAILKNAPILILDEATSALDSESEKAVQEALRQLSMNRTSIIIAHRLATVERADRIFVLDDGALVDSGTHNELLGKGGLYADLYALQFRDSV